MPWQIAAIQHFLICLVLCSIQEVVKHLYHFAINNNSSVTFLMVEGECSNSLKQKAKVTATKLVVLL